MTKPEAKPDQPAGDPNFLKELEALEESTQGFFTLPRKRNKKKDGNTKQT